MIESVFPEDIAFITHVQKKAEHQTRGYFLSDFYSSWEISLARFALERNKLSFEEWGGYKQALKKRLIGYKSNFNRSLFHISCYMFKPSNFIAYHSKGAVFNALTAHGIKPDKVGDILTTSDAYFVFLDNELTIPSIYDAEIIVTKDIPSEMAGKPKEDITGTVSSLRLDAILAVAFKPSRNKIQGLIENGGAMVNYRYSMKPAKELVEGDIVSLRGFPRFKLSGAGEETKKGRIRVRLEFVD